MNYTLQLHGEKRVFPVPDGLYELMSDIAREVLRAQPTNIVVFIADYLTALIDARHATSVAIDILEDTYAKGTYNAEYLKSKGLTEAEATKAASIIQKAYRGYKKEKKFRILVKLKAEAVEGPNEILLKYLEINNITLEKANAAARKIQACFRGYITRKNLAFTVKSALSWVPSHDNWRHDWLWKDFVSTTTEGVKSHPVNLRKISKRILPHRTIKADQLKLHTLYEGQLGNLSNRQSMSTLLSFPDRYYGMKDILNRTEEEYLEAERRSCAYVPINLLRVGEQRRLSKKEEHSTPGILRESFTKTEDRRTSIMSTKPRVSFRKLVPTTGAGRPERSGITPVSSFFDHKDSFLEDQSWAHSREDVKRDMEEREVTFILPDKSSDGKSASGSTKSLFKFSMGEGDPKDATSENKSLIPVESESWEDTESDIETDAEEKSN